MRALPRVPRRTALVVALLAASIPSAHPAHAQTTHPQTAPPIAEAGASPRPDTAPRPAPTSADVQRPFLYTPDPSAPGSGQVLASLGAGYAQIDRGAARPFAGNIAQAGAVFSAGAEVGLFRVASLHADGLLAGDGSSINTGAMLGASIYPFPRRWPVALAVSGGYLRELGGANGAWGRATFAGDLGALRLMISALGSHVFAPGRDGVDLLLSTGASFRLNPIVRLGVEYVVQDLEGALDDEELDGGLRHFLGPSVGLSLAKRVQITAGPSFGLSKGAPGLQGRMAATYAF